MTMIGGGFAHKVCSCEDFPCCGHNDVDPNWQPDPIDQMEDWENYDIGPGDPQYYCGTCHEPGDDYDTDCENCGCRDWRDA